MSEMRIGKAEAKEVRMKEIIERVKSQVSLEEICRKYGTDLIKRGSDYVCLCPFVPESNPSLRIYTATNTFHCFSCSAHGDVIKYVRLREKLEFMPALKKLACMLGIDVPAPLIDEGDSTKRRPNRILELAVDFYYRLMKYRLERQDPAIGGFLRNRGIVMESVDRFRIGFAPFNNKLAAFLLKTRGFHPDEVLSTGLIRQNDAGDFYPFFSNRIIFPFYKNGRAAYLTGRSIDEKEPRYLNLPAGEFFKKTIYNSDALRSPAKDIYITEGMIDCILAEQMGLSAIALAGMSTQDDLAKLLIAKNVYIVFDSEESGAGQKGAEKLASDLLIHDKESRIITLPRRPDVAKVDLADYLSSSGKDNFLSLVKQAATLIEIRIDGAAQENEASRNEYIRNAILPLICHPRIEEMDRAKYLDRIKSKLELGTDMFLALKREVSEIRKSQRFDHPAEVSTEKSYELTAQEKEEALRYLKAPNLIQNLVTDIRTVGIVGEDTNALVLYLLSLTRKTVRPISAVVFGDSSAGKSYLVTSISSLIPEEDLLVLSSASARSFEHAAESQLKNKFIVVQEMEGMEQVESTIRVMQSEGRLARFVTVKNEETNRMESIYRNVECPACIITTTTRDRVHPENMTRIFELYVNQTPEQTAQIHDLDREKVMYGWTAKEKQIASTIALHKNIQRVIADIKVIIPFAKHIDFPKESIRSRRDFPRFLDLIKAVSLIRQYQKNQMKTIDGVEYIEADLDDYGIAYELGTKLFEATFSPISERARDVLRVCLEIQKEKFTRDDIRQRASELGIHVSANNKTLAGQLRSLCEDIPALELLEGSQGKTYVYGKKISSLEELNGAQISLIPTADQIASKISREGEKKEAAHELACTSQN